MMMMMMTERRQPALSNEHLFSSGMDNLTSLSEYSMHVDGDSSCDVWILAFGHKKLLVCNDLRCMTGRVRFRMVNRSSTRRSFLVMKSVLR